MLSAGTDGSDGPTEAAGAFVDGYTCREALKKGVDAKEHLLNNDSYNFFKALDDLFITGPTRTNVMDVICLLVEKGQVNG
jgi:hydroxypyruvate reductase